METDNPGPPCVSHRPLSLQPGKWGGLGMSLHLGRVSVGQLPLWLRNPIKQPPLSQSKCPA